MSTTKPHADRWRLVSGFLASVERVPERPALTVDGETLSYAELHARAVGIAADIRRHAAAHPDAAPLTAVHATGSWVAYAGVLGALLAGHAYVPIHPAYPASRSASILAQSRASSLITDRHACAQVDQLPLGDTALSQVICPQAEPGASWAAAGLSVGDGSGAPDEPLPEDPEQDVAYVLFTSGSTGRPKGVPIRHGNLRAFFAAAQGFFDYSEQDRFTQLFELTFDLSVYDLFLAWGVGGQLVVPSKEERFAPAAYLREHAISCWFAVPSLAQQMSQQGVLQAGAFPDLRLSLFCGEGLPVELAGQWLGAAPNGRLENWYGPTEATISCTRFVIDAAALEARTPAGLVSIGEPFPGMAARVVNDKLKPVRDGKTGELAVGGAQVARGYLDDPEKTSAAFVRLPGEEGTWYRTGDKVVRDKAGQLHFLSRLDKQVKVRGYRIELGEIEGAVRAVCDGAAAVALPWPPGAPNANSIVAAVEGAPGDVGARIAALHELLPDYMVPAQLFALERFPTNFSGKVDRKKLANKLQAQIDAYLAAALGEGADDVADRLMRAILESGAGLDPERIRSAENLLDAGLDSLGFVSLTARIETMFDMQLGDREVYELSLLDFEEFVAAVSGRKLVKPRKGRHSKHLVRTRQFLERFDAFLEQHDASELAIVWGSSGIYRGLDTAAFDAAAARRGRPLRAVNVGLAGLDQEGLAQVAEFVAERCRAAGRTLALSVLEIDPMLLSVIPPPGEHEIIAEVLGGLLRLDPTLSAGEEFTWRPEVAGSIEFEVDRDQAEFVPDWQKRRNHEIATTYLGGTEFDERAVAAWSRGARALAAVSEATAGFVHPINSTTLDEVSVGAGPHRHRELLARLSAQLGLTIHDHEAFGLVPEDFLNVNHVNHWQGVEAFSRRLAELVVGERAALSDAREGS